MTRRRRAYSAEYREQMVELFLAGRSAEALFTESRREIPKKAAA